MANTLANIARMTTNTTGTGTMSLIAAVDGYLTFEDAGINDGDVVTYAVHEGSKSEVGQGTYTSTGVTLSRSTVYASTNNGAQISLSGNAEVFITLAKEDFATFVDTAGSPSANDIAVFDDANTIEGSSALTYDGTLLSADAALYLQERAIAEADVPGYGQIWVKNDSPNTLWWTNDDGTDVQIAAGYVDTTGTPVANQVAIFTDADTLQGVTGLTYDGSELRVTGPVYMAEQNAANADVATLGQLWIKNDTPNIPKFTDDAGTDFDIILDSKAQAITAKTNVASDVFECDNGYTVAGLPAGTVGQIARVTDANAPSVGSTVAGGGAAAALCWYNGTNWTVIGV